MKDSLTIMLCPPSVNTFYMNIPGRGRIISKKGREFKQYIESSLKSLIAEKELKYFGNKRLKISYEFNFKDKRKRDCDNYIKPMQDCLTGILFEDDEQVDEIIAKRNYKSDYNFTEIDIESI